MSNKSPSGEILLKEIRSELQGISLFIMSNSLAFLEYVFSKQSQFNDHVVFEDLFFDLTNVPFPEIE